METSTKQTISNLKQEINQLNLHISHLIKVSPELNSKTKWNYTKQRRDNARLTLSKYTKQVSALKMKIMLLGGNP